jgi:hypothetical protein
MKSMIAAAAVMIVALTSIPARAQEIDKVLSRVNDNVVTVSDVWRAKTLKQVAPTATTDDAVQRELEDRALMLTEVARFSIPPPSADQLAARRSAWRAKFAAGEAETLLARTGTTAANLDDWLRDDARIDAYLTQQFTQPDATVRAIAIRNWLDVLRRRAGLPR